MTNLTLNDVYPNWLSGDGIFSDLQNLSVPWQSDNISTYLDMEYHGNMSGDKLLSPLMEKSLTDNELSDAMRFLIATTILSVYGTNWTKQWVTQELTYNPISNYDMTETLSQTGNTNYGKTRTHTDNTTHTKTGTEDNDVSTSYGKTESHTNSTSHSKTGTETQTPNLTTSTQDSVYGFNTVTSVSANDSTATATGTNTTTYNVTETTTGNNADTTGGSDTGTNTITYDVSESVTGTNTDNDGGTDTETLTRTLSRSGNIGITTSQQMLQSERDLWKWNFFHDVVFPDIDRILTIQIY